MKGNFYLRSLLIAGLGCVVTGALILLMVPGLFEPTYRTMTGPP